MEQALSVFLPFLLDGLEFSEFFTFLLYKNNIPYIAVGGFDCSAHTFCYGPKIDPVEKDLR